MKTKLLFLILSLLIIPYVLFAKETLPLLVEGGEPFNEDRDKFYIKNHDSIDYVTMDLSKNIIVTGTNYGVIHIWNFKTPGFCKKFIPRIEKIGSLKNISLTKDGRNIFLHESGILSLWNIKKQKIIKSFQYHTGIVYSMLSYDEKEFIAYTRDNYLILWDIETNKVLKEIRIEKNVVGLIKNGSRNFLIIELNNSINLWDIKEEKIIISIQKKDIQKVKFIKISKQNSLLLLTYEDSTAEIWDIEANKLVLKVKGDRVNISDDGKRIAFISSEKLKIMDIIKKEVICEYSKFSSVWNEKIYLEKDIIATVKYGNLYIYNIKKRINKKKSNWR